MLDTLRNDLYEFFIFIVVFAPFDRCVGCPNLFITLFIYYIYCFLAWPLRYILRVGLVGFIEILEITLFV